MANEPGIERILDVRPESAFLERHRVGAVNIPLESLSRRIHELPPPNAPLTVYDENRTRALWAKSRLRARGRTNVVAADGKSWVDAGKTTSGPSQDRLWQPHALLNEAVNVARQCWGRVDRKVALDIACGTGRDAAFLAMSGFTVEAWDVLPDALERCEEIAKRHGVSVRARCRDVEQDTTIEPEQYDLVCCFNFLHRPLMPHLAGAVRRGGLVVYETFTDAQKSLFGKPKRDAFLLKPGELTDYFADWEILVYREGLTGPRRHAASLIARRPS